MDPKKIVLIAVGFAALTLILILAGLKLSPPVVRPDAGGLTSPESFRSQKSDLAEPDPLISIPEPLTMGQVASFQTKVREIVRSIKPLPVFPGERVIVSSGPTDPEGGIMKNLYKETNRYYIPSEGSAPATGTAGTPGRQRYDAGIKE